MGDGGSDSIVQNRNRSGDIEGDPALAMPKTGERLKNANKPVDTTHGRR